MIQTGKLLYLYHAEPSCSADDSVVRQLEHPKQDVNTVWKSQFRDAATFIEDVYSTYAPHVSEADRSKSITLGATGLSGLERRYGRDETAPRIYCGSAERGVLATYHHAGHSRDFIKDLFRYAAVKNTTKPGTYDIPALVRFPIIGAYHDAIIGHGRGYDEQLSADMTMKVMRLHSFPVALDKPTSEAAIRTKLIEDEPVHAAIIATTWDPRLERQAVDESSPYVEYQLAAASADLLPLFDRRGPYKALCLAVEDMCKVINDRIFSKIAVQSKFDYGHATLDQCIAFIDSVDVLRERFSKILRGKSAFFEHFRPADPELDAMFPGRADNAAFLFKVSELFGAHRITAQQLLLEARGYSNLAV